MICIAFIMGNLGWLLFALAIVYIGAGVALGYVAGRRTGYRRGYEAAQSELRAVGDKHFSDGFEWSGR